MTNSSRWILYAAVVVVCSAVAVGVGVMLALGNGGGSEPTKGGRSRQAVGARTPPNCADVFRVGKKIDDAMAGGSCTDPDGGVRVVGSFRCNDGRHLYQVDANTGASAGWGFGGDTYRAAKDAASDPEYAKAYEACHS